MSVEAIISLRLFIVYFNLIVVVMNINSNGREKTIALSWIHQLRFIGDLMFLLTKWRFRNRWNWSLMLLYEHCINSIFDICSDFIGEDIKEIIFHWTDSSASFKIPSFLYMCCRTTREDSRWNIRLMVIMPVCRRFLAWTANKDFVTNMLSIIIVFRRDIRFAFTAHGYVSHKINTW